MHMRAKKIDVMHKKFGESEGNQCRTCCHLISGQYRGKWYHKCKLYGMSLSEATDWRLKYPACGAYNVPEDKLDVWTVLEKVVRERNSEPPLEGQVKLDDV